MKPRLILIFLAGIAMIFVLHSCRYDKGPIISFRTVNSRLCPAIWQIDQFSVNSEDMTQIFIDSNNCNMYFDAKTHVNFTGQCGHQFYRWAYKLIDFKSKMDFEMDGITSDFIMGPFGKFRSSVWNIHKLTNQKLWIETNYDGNAYYIKMHKIEQY